MDRTQQLDLLKQLRDDRNAWTRQPERHRIHATVGPLRLVVDDLPEKGVCWQVEEPDAEAVPMNWTPAASVVDAMHHSVDFASAFLQSRHEPHPAE